MDEVGTPDSSRIWEGGPYRTDGRVVEKSKEEFRKLLQGHFPDPDILLNKNRMEERQALDTTLPCAFLEAVSKTCAAPLAHSPAPWRGGIVHETSIPLRAAGTLAWRRRSRASRCPCRRTRAARLSPCCATSLASSGIEAA